MPLYEYECKHCKRRIEKIQKFSDPEITACPHCGGPLERVLHAPAISFKGGGWYADGYGNAKPTAAAQETKSSSDASAGASPETAASSSKDPAPASSSKESTSSAAPAAAAPSPPGAQK